MKLSDLIDFKGRYILASASPRRAALLHDMGLEFEVMASDIDESFPCMLPVEEIPVFLAKRKAQSFDFNKFDTDIIVIAADTIVATSGEVLNKPADAEEAKIMLRKLSANTHEVITGVCVKSKEKEIAFYDISNVTFSSLDEKEIAYYVANFKPFDKAGSYGIQEWIGLTGISAIKGSFYNVMGLPTEKLWKTLKVF